MRPWAVITGASEGIGAAFALQLAKGGMHNIVLIARTESKLNKVKEQVLASAPKGGDDGLIECEILVQDLSVQGAALEIYGKTKDKAVSLLINNAALMTVGRFDELELHYVQKITMTNCIALAELSLLFLPGLNREHKRTLQWAKDNKRRAPVSGLLNVSSLLGFIGVASTALYAATKAYIINLTEAIHDEQRRSGSSLPVICLAPGGTRTSIWDKGGMIPLSRRMPQQSPSGVAAVALQALSQRPGAIVVPGFMNKIFYYSLIRLLPRWAAQALLWKFGGQDTSKRSPEEVLATFERHGRKAPQSVLDRLADQRLK